MSADESRCEILRDGDDDDVARSCKPWDKPYMFAEGTIVRCYACGLRYKVVRPLMLIPFGARGDKEWQRRRLPWPKSPAAAAVVVQGTTKDAPK